LRMRETDRCNNGDQISFVPKLEARIIRVALYCENGRAL